MPEKLNREDRKRQGAEETAVVVDLTSRTGLTELAARGFLRRFGRSCVHRKNPTTGRKKH